MFFGLNHVRDYKWLRKQFLSKKPPKIKKYKLEISSLDFFNKVLVFLYRSHPGFTFE